VGGSTENLLEYSQEVLNGLNQDTDGDGIPDEDDALPSIDDNSGDFMSQIAQINGVVDDISEDLDTIIE